MPSDSVLITFSLLIPFTLLTLQITTLLAPTKRDYKTPINHFALSTLLLACCLSLYFFHPIFYALNHFRFNPNLVSPPYKLEILKKPNYVALLNSANNTPLPFPNLYVTPLFLCFYSCALLCLNLPELSVDFTGLPLNACVPFQLNSPPLTLLNYKITHINLKLLISTSFTLLPNCSYFLLFFPALNPALILIDC